MGGVLVFTGAVAVASCRIQVQCKLCYLRGMSPNWTELDRTGPVVDRTRAGPEVDRSGLVPVHLRSTSGPLRSPSGPRGYKSTDK